MYGGHTEMSTRQSEVSESADQCSLSARYDGLVQCSHEDEVCSLGLNCQEVDVSALSAIYLPRLSNS